MLSWCCRKLLGLGGWSVTSDKPDTRKYVLVVAPHTSNWDFPIGLLAAGVLQLDAHWLGKHSLFHWPYGWLFRALGGLPVYRNQSLNLIEQMRERFETSDRLILALAPEGTRSRTEYWKSGFYHIARAAGVPIVMAYLDYPRKQVHLGGAFMPGENTDADLEQMNRFFSGHFGKHPESSGPVALAEKKDGARATS